MEKYKYEDRLYANSLVHLISENRFIETRESKEIEEVYVKAKAWDRLKQRVITDYITLSNTDEDGSNIDTLLGEILRLEKTGEYMDWLDDTEEFSNILHDLNRSE